MCILYIVPSFRGSPLEHGIFVPCTYYMPYLSTALYITHLQPAVGVFPPSMYRILRTFALHTS